MDEFAVIKRYFLNAMMPSHVKVGPGDDCAVISIPQGQELCVSTDTLLEAVHFPKNSRAKVVANRSIAANLSDLAAMGCVPHGMTLALTLPDVDEAWLEEFSLQSQRLASKYGCPIIGGNLAKGSLSITITVMGLIDSGKAILRSGAKVGDAIFVSGDLGAAAGAVAQLGLEKPNLQLLQRYEQPIPQLELGRALNCIASSAIDISDGLVSDLTHIVEASSVGASIDLDKLPLNPTLTDEFGRDKALQLAMHGGDDYQLCFTLAYDQVSMMAELTQQLGVPLTQIGEITAGPGVIHSRQGDILQAKGYQHFQKIDKQGNGSHE